MSTEEPAASTAAPAAPRKRHILRWVLLGIVALVVVAGAVLYVWINSIARETVVRFGKDFTGAPVQLAAINIRPFAGQGTIQGLTLGNPDGFQSPHAIAVKEAHFSFALGSLLSDTLQVQVVEVKGVDVHCEATDNKLNLLEIVKHLLAQLAALPAGGGKGLALDKAALQDVTVHVHGQVPDRAFTVHLDGIESTPMQGRAVLKNVVIRNPKGFASEQAIQVQELHAGLQPGSLATSTIHLDEIRLKGVNVVYEPRPNGSNVDKLAEVLKDLEACLQKSEGKHAFTLKDFHLEDTKVKPQAGLLSMVPAISLPPIHLQNLHGDDFNGLCKAIRDGVTPSVAGVFEGLGNAIGKLGGALGKGAEGVTKGVGKGVDKTVGTLLKGFLRQGEKKEEGDK